MLGLSGTFQNHNGCQSLLEPQRRNGCCLGDHPRQKLEDNLPGFSLSPTLFLHTNNPIGHLRQGCQPAGFSEYKEQRGVRREPQSKQLVTNCQLSGPSASVLYCQFFSSDRTPTNTEVEATEGFQVRKSFTVSQRKCHSIHKEATCLYCYFQTASLTIYLGTSCPIPEGQGQWGSLGRLACFFTPNQSQSFCPAATFCTCRTLGSSLESATLPTFLPWVAISEPSSRIPHDAND